MREEMGIEKVQKRPQLQRNLRSAIENFARAAVIFSTLANPPAKAAETKHGTFATETVKETSKETRNNLQSLKEGQFLKTFGEAIVPWGWTDFCQQLEKACQEMDAKLSEKLKPARFDVFERKKFQALNTHVNAKVGRKTDLDQYGVSEKWKVAKIGGYGDCEDLALLKREMLLESGYHPSQLLITVVDVPSSSHPTGWELHAVLTVRTTEGDIWLDSKYDKIESPEAFINQYNYKPAIIQSQESVHKWLALDSTYKKKADK